MDEDGTITLQYIEDSNIARIDVRSRNINSKTYKCYIHYEPNSTYYCNCPKGRRTIGCCSHISAIIYYLAYASYQSKIFIPVKQLSGIFGFEMGENDTIIDENSDTFFRNSDEGRRVR